MLRGVGQLGLIPTSRRSRFFIGPDQLVAPFALTRTQASSIKSTALDSTALAYVEYVADVARFNGVARRLLIEGTRTNSIRNPRGEGAVAGVPGTAPTNWSVSTTGSGITREIVGAGTEGGLDYVDFKFSGTNSLGGTLQLVINGEPNNSAVAAEGQVWTTSAFVRLVDGSLSGLTSIVLITRARNSGGTQIAIANPTIVPTSAALTTQRFSATLTMPALTAFSNSSITITMPNAAVVDFTLRVAGYQLELGGFTSSLILPPVASPAVAVRGTDSVSSSLANLGLSSGGVCTVLLSGMLPQQSTAIQGLLQIDDGTSNNRYLARVDANGLALNLYRVIGGVGAGIAAIGTLVAGTPFRFGLTIDSAGRVAASLNGNAVASHSGGPTSGLTSFRLGSENAGVSPAFMEFGPSMRILPYAMSDNQLRAATASFS